MRQRIAGHDRAEAVEQRACQPRLHGRQRHPPVVHAQETVRIELRRRVVTARLTAAKRLDARLHVEVCRRDADPILHLVGDDGRRLVTFDEQKPRLPGLLQELATAPFDRPAKEDDVHGARR